MKISYWVYLIIMPYILLAVCIGLFKPLGSTDLTPYLLVVIPTCCILNIICIFNIVLGNLHTLRKGSCVAAARRNFWVKYLHIPVYLFLALIFGGMMNPFLMIASIIPLACAGGLMMYSGSMNIAACIKLSREHKISPTAAVILCLCGYVFVVDLIAAIFQVMMSKKESDVNLIRRYS